MKNELRLPTKAEYVLARAAFEQGEYELMEKYLTHALAWFLEKVRSGFDHEKFIAVMLLKVKKEPSEKQIKKARIRAECQFRKEAAMFASALGCLLLLQNKRERGLPYLEQAVELDPKNTTYVNDLAEANRHS